MVTKSAWYRQWFGEEYLQLYPHRDAEEARRAVDLVLSHVRARGGPVLDLACGAGRHLREFRARGVSIVGIDLSEALLRRAQAHDDLLVRGDMRSLPFGAATFGLVTSFFTSFGYFDDPDEDFQVLREVRRVLQDDGMFAFDFLNAERTRAELRERDVQEIGGRQVVQTRTLVEGGAVVEKRIEIMGEPTGGEAKVFYERVRLYTGEEIRALLVRAGLLPDREFGDYHGAPLTDESQRVIYIGRAG